jgi:hypothetical protein
MHAIDPPRRRAPRARRFRSPDGRGTVSGTLGRFIRALLLALSILAGGAMPASTQGLLIVSLGDSYASGEGAPDRDAVGCNLLGIITLPPAVSCGASAAWTMSPAQDALAASDLECDRSSLAGARQAADVIRTESSAPVTFLSFACSGATTADLISRGQHSDIGPQIAGAAARTSGRRIDALLVSIGGNDAGFPAMVVSCIVQFDCRLSGAEIDRRASDLGAAYDRLAAALRPLNARNVFFTEYPIPLFDENGRNCGGRPLGDPLALVSPDEAQWAATVAMPRLNRALREAVARHQGEGWKLVTGIEAGFSRRGYCAADRALNDVRDSYRKESKEAGSAHPNRGGQAIYRDAILAVLRPLVPLRRPVLVTGRVSAGGLRTRAFPPDSTVLHWEFGGPPQQRFQVAFRPALYGQRLVAPLPARSDGVPENPDAAWTQVGGWMLVPSVAATASTFTHRTHGTWDYVVRSCSPSACSSWSDPVRVSDVAASPAAPANLRPVRAIGGVVTVGWDLPEHWVGSEYQVAWREVPEPALQFPRAPAPAPVWQSAWLRSDSGRVMRGTAGSGAMDFYVRHRGSAVCSLAGCEPPRTSPWSAGVRVWPRPPTFVPTLSTEGESTVKWGLPLRGANHTVFQLAAYSGGASASYVTLPSLQLRYAFTTRPAMVWLRACNDAGCGGWSSPVVWRTVPMMRGRDPLASAPVPPRPSPGPRAGPPPPDDLP